MSDWIAPEQLLARLGVAGPEEIVVEEIAQFCGATILYEDLHGCAARIVGHGDRAIISVDTNSHRPRQRFSAAHELGHWMRDRGKAAFACTEQMLASEWGATNAETRANQYAADLLLPRAFFKPDARGRAITLSSVDDLADRYKTSRTATALRLVALGSYPSMLVCCRAGRRWKWFKRSPDLPRTLWPREEPGSDTLAHDLLARGDSGPVEADVTAAGWFGLPGADRYYIRESAIRIPGGVLALLWWEDEEQLLSLG